jgi:hypothetical protein
VNVELIPLHFSEMLFGLMEEEWLADNKIHIFDIVAVKLGQIMFTH